ncbi:hypothetical protein [Paenibacillus endoradicis]|uniref:hypothetical protein n=1 Tax=Paenibacillus endoradicis TaxID=2972487 RepID=UPI0021592B41|nr:hypothetical protein [Paenibacillus endoradicis]MCR8659925.1 hypothetical protein [Paenibacillus endoradicis]
MGISNVTAYTKEEYAVMQTIRDNINPQELIELLLELGNIRSIAGFEREAGEYVYDWLKKEGFSTRKIGMVEDRFNVIGTMGGDHPGEGKNLLFTSHLDTESPQYNDRDNWRYRPETVLRPEWLEAKFENGVFSGRPVENDRGPMTCTLIAAKALKNAGLPLKGHLYITASPGEIGPEQVEEFRGTEFLGKEVGAQYLLSHGGVAPDYVIAAEGTDFGITWMSCGHALYRIDLYGEEIFTPMINHPKELQHHPNPLVQVAVLIEKIQQWAVQYEQENTYKAKGGESIPKVQISAIRGGDPHIMGAGSEVCSVYIEVNITAKQSIAPIQRQLEALLHGANMQGQVLPLVYRQGHEADDEVIAPLVDAIATGSLAGARGELQLAHYAYSSMWRDHNVFNMYRIPSATFGPARFQPTIEDMVDAAAIYAFTAWKICNS